MDSILQSIKKLVGIPAEHTHFDDMLIMYINSTFMVLRQLGVGPPEGFTIYGADESWDEYFGEGVPDSEGVKTYVGMKVKLLFDPPLSSAALEATKQQVAEMEWRINVAFDKKDEVTK